MLVFWRMMQHMSMQEAAHPAERTTVTLPAPLARQVRVLSMSKGRSVSSIVREALEAYLQGQPPPELPSFVGAGDSGRGDLSVRVEELLREKFTGERGS